MSDNENSKNSANSSVHETIMRVIGPRIDRRRKSAEAYAERLFSKNSENYRCCVIGYMAGAAREHTHLMVQQTLPDYEAGLSS